MNTPMLRVNTADVVHELVEGEVIAIDLGRGSYYSLSGGAVGIWTLLIPGATADEVVAAFVDAPDAGALKAEVDGLLERLRAEGLIVEAERNGDGRPAEQFAYKPIVFEKYEDLQDYFLLDPIHEVGETGWPAPRPS